MMNSIRHCLKIIKVIFIMSHKQLLIHSGDFQLPRCMQCFAFIFCNIMYPIGAFIKPKNSFGHRLAEFFCELGPIAIKLGQTLSTRPDIVGVEVAESLQFLQDKLPMFDIKTVHNKIQKNFGQDLVDLFDDFEEKPVAAASIAQVHKARLKTGEIVAVKVLRPGIMQTYENDIQFLEFCVKIILIVTKTAKRLKLVEVMAVFKRSLKSELDLRSEAAAASKLHDNYGNGNHLLIPKVYWDLTAVDILTLEWVSGVSIYNKEKIYKLGLDPRDIATKIAIIFFNQVYRDGFFHADLHPGNIFVCQDGKIGLVDFGIVGVLPENDRLAIAEILYAFLKRDYHLVAKIHQRIGYIPKDTDLYQFAMSCRAIAEPIIGIDAITKKDISIGNVLSQLFKVTEEYGMETQPQLLLLQKTILVVEGIGKSLNHNNNMWQLAEPWIKRWAIQNLSPEAKILRIIKKLYNEFLI